MHNVTQRSHGTGYDRNLLYRLCVLLKSTYKGMSHFMIRYDFPLLRAENTVFFLLAYQDHFH